MHPAVVAGNLLEVAVEVARDRLAEVCLGHAHEGAHHAEDRGHLVVELEHPVLDVDLVQGEVGHQV